MPSLHHWEGKVLNHITALYTAQGSTFLRWRRASHAGEVSSRQSSRVGEGVRGSGGQRVRGSGGQGAAGTEQHVCSCHTLSLLQELISPASEGCKRWSSSHADKRASVAIFVLPQQFTESILCKTVSLLPNSKSHKTDLLHALLLLTLCTGAATRLACW